MSGIVYHAFDTETGKGYVGQTIQSLEERIKQHRKPGPFVFGRAFRKRPEAFVWTVLCKLSVQQDLDDAETAFMKELDTLWPAGYNMMEGGRGGKKTAEHRRKISEALKGHAPAKTVFQNGHTSFWKGKKLSPEHAAKIAASKRKRHVVP